MNSVLITSILLALLQCCNGFTIKNSTPSASTTEIDLSFFDDLESQTPEPNVIKPTKTRPSTIQTYPALSSFFGNPVNGISKNPSLHSSPPGTSYLRQVNPISMSAQSVPSGVGNVLSHKDSLAFYPFAPSFPLPNYSSSSNPDTSNILRAPVNIPSFSFPSSISQNSPAPFSSVSHESPFSTLSFSSDPGQRQLAPYNTPHSSFLQPLPSSVVAPAQMVQSTDPVLRNSYHSSTPMASYPGSSDPYIFLPPMVSSGIPSLGYESSSPIVATFVRSYVPQNQYMSIPFLYNSNYILSNPSFGYANPSFEFPVGNNPLSTTNFHDDSSLSLASNIPSVSNTQYIPQSETVPPSHGQNFASVIPSEVNSKPLTSSRYSVHDQTTFPFTAPIGNQRLESPSIQNYGNRYNNFWRIQS